MRLMKWSGWRRRQPKPKSKTPARAASRLVEALEPRAYMTVPIGFEETRVVSDLKNPTSMEFAPDGRIFVSEQGGKVRVVKNGRTNPAPFFTVPTAMVGELGMSSVVLDPDFAANGHVYVYWTVPAAGGREAYNKVTRVTAAPGADTAIPGSEVTIFEGDPIGTRINHVGGAMHFGPDGKLYLAIGESNRPQYGQDLSTTHGKIVRLNKDGTAPADNPFVGVAGARPEIWALGFRNPFTFAFQPGTGRMFINDVGNAAYEEINEGVRGGNYGWSLTEGPIQPGVAPPANYQEPLFAYDHTQGCAITGAGFYNPANPTFPAEYLGTYFYGDVCTGRIRRYDAATDTFKNFAFEIQRPLDFEVTPDGALWVLNNSKTDAPGGITRIQYTRSAAPSINTQPTSKTAPAGQPVTFTVAANGSGLGYQWQRNGADIPGATSSSYTIASVTQADNGAQFRVRVSNANGSVTSNPATLTVASGSAPTAAITSPAAGTKYRGGQAFTFAGTGTDGEDGNLPAGAFTWQVDFHHDDHTHPFIQPTSGVKDLSFTVPANGEVSDNVWYRARLTVRDSDGLEHTVTRDVTPEKVFVTVRANVPGLSFTVDGQPTSGEYLDNAVIGIERLLGAPATQVLDGVTYEFVNWSDGGAIDHGIVTPATDTTYVANYRPAVGDPGPGPANGPDLTAALTGALPAQVLGGAKGGAAVLVNNAGDQPMTGPVTVRLYMSADEALDPSDTVVTSATKKLKLKPGAAKSVKLKYAYPAMPDGNYRLLAQVDPDNGVTEKSESNNVAASTATVGNRAPFVDLSGTFALRPSVVTRGGRPASVALSVLNAGNVTATGPLTISLSASTNADGTGGLVPLVSLTKGLKLKAGASKVFKLKFTAPPQLAAGSYFLTATLDGPGAIDESDEQNNVVNAQGSFSVV